MGKLIDLTGQRFGRLTVLKECGRSKRGSVLWLCICDCKNKCVVLGDHLRSGHTVSCGCYKVHQSIEKIAQYHKDHPGDLRSRDPRLYGIWSDMRFRCYSPKCPFYADYGGRGIVVCREWNDFYVFQTWAFSAGYEPDLTIDRIDVNGNYCPENCRWADWKIQGNNRRNNRTLTYQGETMTIAEWSRRTGLLFSTIKHRINIGWTTERILTEPSRKQKKKL